MTYVRNTSLTGFNSFDNHVNSWIDVYLRSIWLKVFAVWDISKLSNNNNHLNIMYLFYACYAGMSFIDLVV